MESLAAQATSDELERISQAIKDLENPDENIRKKAYASFKKSIRSEREFMGVDDDGNPLPRVIKV